MITVPMTSSMYQVRKSLQKVNREINHHVMSFQAVVAGAEQIQVLGTPIQISNGGLVKVESRPQVTVSQASNGSITITPVTTGHQVLQQKKFTRS